MTSSYPILRCHCDHCQNNTCITHSQGLCYARLLINRNGETETQSNCFDPKEELMQNLICGDHQAKSSTEVTRCCNSTDYCNQDTVFLSELDTAKKHLLYPDLAPGSELLQNLSPDKLITSISEKYSGLPLEIKIVSTISMAALIVTVIVLARRWYSKILNPGRNEDEYSESSSVKIPPDVMVYDTNSMASREPLIANCFHVGCGHNTTNLMTTCTATSQNHPTHLRSPWMSEDKNPATVRSTFAITMGSGDPGTNRADNSSGSGSGQPYLTQRSIAHDIELLNVVGRGYFGVVWRGEYKGEPVAVKIFSAKAEPSWEREAEIYQTTLLRHKNILGFIATDKRDDVSMTGYWLVTDYYSFGSLHDFLKNNSLSMFDSVRMTFSIASGLAHLHTEIFGTQGKPAIAHRDLKSKNILVKNDGTCCIADLGMAVRYNSQTNVVDVPTNARVGTRRYLSPEILENKLNLMDFDSVKACDVYSTGLVFWEILRRTCYSGTPQDLKGTSLQDLSNAAFVSYDNFELPYQEYIPGDPSAEEMRVIVCEEKQRPSLSYRWTMLAPLRDLSTLMRECWYEKPQARLSALRIRKTLGDIARHYFNQHMEYD